VLPTRVASALLPALLIIALSGCGLFAAAVDEADDAHVVTLTTAGCEHVVVKTQGDGFGLLAPVEPLVLRRGDMLVGPLRRGQIPLRLLPFPEQDLGPAVVFDVHAAGVSLAAAQSLWRQVCPVPATI